MEYQKNEMDSKYPATELEKKIEHLDIDVASASSLVCDETLNLTEQNDVSPEELERYNFLMETSKELYPGVCHYFIHTCVIEQIQEEKGIEINPKNVEEIRDKYDNNLEYASMEIKNFDDE
jgi:hypothetical protein